MNWKQKLAEAFHQRRFEDFNSDEQSIAEKSVELYQKELNEKNVGLSVSEFFEVAKTEEQYNHIQKEIYEWGKRWKEGL
jgi:murein L,D-transpeptidase YafK